MAYTTIAPTPAASVSTTRSKPSCETSLEAALEHARRLTEMSGTRNIDRAIAWETVEELQTARARKQASSQSAFARYCAANPSALECRIYDS